MKKRNMKDFTVFFETQWPRLMELQKSFYRAQVRANNYHDYWMAKRIARKERLERHAEKINDHRKWFITQEYGPDIQWVSTWVDRRGNLSELPKGNGYRGEILQYILWEEKV